MPGEAAEPLATPGPFAEEESDGADSAASLGSTNAAAPMLLTPGRRWDGVKHSAEPACRCEREAWGKGESGGLGNGAAPL